MSNLPISEQYRIVAKQFVEQDAAASLLEETKSAVLAQHMAAMGDMPVSKAEMAAMHNFLSCTRRNESMLPNQMEKNLFVQPWVSSTCKASIGL